MQRCALSGQLVSINHDHAEFRFHNCRIERAPVPGNWRRKEPDLPWNARKPSAGWSSSG
jgi:hypothetical protein